MSKLGTVVPVSDASFGSLPPHARDTEREQPPAAKDLPDVRLIIEEDQVTGAFIYKTIERRTGQVIQQFPREEILRLKQEGELDAGAIINARV